jgi:heme/copper-type cytochrome/quinol oxidase subunit 1
LVLLSSLSDIYIAGEFYIIKVVLLFFEHLFWFLGHPEVYIVLLPALGYSSEVIATNSRKPIWLQSDDYVNFSDCIFYQQLFGVIICLSRE